MIKLEFTDLSRVLSMFCCGENAILRWGMMIAPPPRQLGLIGQKSGRLAHAFMESILIKDSVHTDKEKVSINKSLLLY